MHSIKNILFCFLMLFLTGCAVSNDSFDCKYSKGVGCHSITEVNSMVNQGKLNVESTEPVSNTASSSVAICPDSLNVDFMEVERVTEAHLRLWIAPFQDKHGNFHEGAIVHTVLKPGYWQVREGC